MLESSGPPSNREMSQLLVLFRAARIVGVTRGELQKKIKEGTLRAYDGMVSSEDLLAAYPETKFAEDVVIEHLTRIKDEAFAKRVREHVLPNQEVLAARLYQQSRELADVKNHLQRYHAVVVLMQERLHDLQRVYGNDPQPDLASLAEWLNGRLESLLNTEAPDPFIVMDDYLRVVSAQVTLSPSGHNFFVEGTDTILEAALRAGLALNYGCSAGNCGLCKARVVSGQTQKVRHFDYVLSEAEKNMGYALMCSHAPITDVVIEALEAAGPSDIPQQEIITRVKSTQTLREDLILLHLQTPRTKRLRFLAGQNVRLSLSEEISADLGVASCPCDDRNLQFHVRNLPDSKFAQQVFRGLKSGDNVTLRGPFGNFVLFDDSPRALLFIACDTGFAPIKSLIEHAMALDIGEAIHLAWISTYASGHYQANLCRSWADALDNFYYSEFTAATPQGVNEVLTQITSSAENLADFDIYIAGPEPFVAAARTWIATTEHPQSQLFCQIA